MQANEERILEGIAGKAIEIKAKVNIRNYSIMLRSLRTDVSTRPPENAPLPLQEDHIVELRSFIDRSMIEV